MFLTSTSRSNVQGQNTSRIKRQQDINKKYLMADPTQALETTNMNVFKERSAVSSFAPLNQVSYLASTKSMIQNNNEAVDRKRQRRKKNKDRN